MAAAAGTLNMDLVTASLGRPVVWAYGEHWVGGNVILRDDTDSSFPIIFIGLGRGEWDGPVSIGGVVQLQLNGAMLSGTEYHFHPGIAGEKSSEEPGHELDPISTGGDNKVDLWYPDGVQRLTYSHLAYLAIKFNAAEIDPSGIAFIGRFKTRKVQWYDSEGGPAAYEYTTNPVKQWADLLIRAGGYAVSDIDWEAANIEANYCDADITIGGVQVDRFVSHIGFTSVQDIETAARAILDNCRGVWTEYNGLITPRIAKVRAPIFISFSKANIIEGSFRHSQENVWQSFNRLEMVFNDPDNGLNQVTKRWDHEVHQARTGRIRVENLPMSSMPQHQAERIGNYLLTRVIDLNEFVELIGRQDSLHIMPGDVVNVAHDAADWVGNETFDVEEVEPLPDLTRRFRGRLYRDAAYSDAAGAAQNLLATTIAKHWDPQLEDSPPPVTGQGASEGPDFAEDGTVVSKITVSFILPSPLGNWGCCEIWKATLDGPGGALTENPVLVAELITSPASWQWRPNGEWVRLYFVSVGTGGRRADILTSPTAEVSLDGQTSPPVPVSGFAGVADGQQVRLSWNENLEADMDHYDIARRDSAGPPGETDIITRAVAGKTYTTP